MGDIRGSFRYVGWCQSCIERATSAPRMAERGSDCNRENVDETSKVLWQNGQTICIRRCHPSTSWLEEEVHEKSGILSGYHRNLCQERWDALPEWIWCDSTCLTRTSTHHRGSKHRRPSTQNQIPPMEWNTMSFLVTCKSNEIARSPMCLNGGRDLNQCILNYRKWLVMSWLFQLPALVWKGSLVYLEGLWQNSEIDWRLQQFEI